MVKRKKKGKREEEREKEKKRKREREKNERKCVKDSFVIQRCGETRNVVIAFHVRTLQV